MLVDINIYIDIDVDIDICTDAQLHLHALTYVRTTTKHSLLPVIQNVWRLFPLSMLRSREEVRESRFALWWTCAT
jgi:hypothetical protein